MNLLKSLYISAYMSAAMATCVYSAWRLFHGGDVVGWLGAMATALPLLVYIGWIFGSRSVPRTSARLPLVNLIGFAGVVAATTSFPPRRWR